MEIDSRYADLYEVQKKIQREYRYVNLIFFFFESSPYLYVIEICINVNVFQLKSMEIWISPNGVLVNLL